MKTILIPTLFTQDSHDVIKEALAFFGSQGGTYKFILLNSYMVSSSSDQLLHNYDDLKKKSLEGIQMEMEMAKSWGMNDQMTFETLSQMGTLRNIISRIVMAYLSKKI